MTCQSTNPELFAGFTVIRGGLFIMELGLLIDYYWNCCYLIDCVIMMTNNRTLRCFEMSSSFISFIMLSDGVNVI